MIGISARPSTLAAFVTDTPSERFGVFDFGLTPEEERRALRLHGESVVVDMLFQGPCGYRSFALLDTPEPLPDESAERRYFSTFFAPIRAALRGDFDEFRACWEHSGITAGNRQVGYGLEAFGIAQAQFDAFPWLVKALRAADIRRAKVEGRRAGFLSTQDTADLGGIGEMAG